MAAPAEVGIENLSGEYVLVRLLCKLEVCWLIVTLQNKELSDSLESLLELVRQIICFSLPNKTLNTVVARNSMGTSQGDGTWNPKSLHKAIRRRKGS
jgi:hypothetical protein